MFSADTPKNFLKPIFIALTVFSAVFVLAPETQAKVIVVKNGNLGVIKGIVRDEGGSPISNAYVSIFRVGTSKLLKQVRSASDGSFLAKILPGTYTVLAVAQGFNPVTLGEVSINRSTELSYGFKLERSGSGNTLPEKRIDRNSSKWRIRAANASRSVYQNTEGDAPIDENAVEESIEIVEAETHETKRKGQSVVQTYFASSDEENYTGVNFATLLPINENTEIVFAAQTGTKNAPQVFEAKAKIRANEKHQIQISSSVGKFGTVEVDNQEKQLGQFSVQALDEWKVSDGVILVLGMDYSRFLGAGNDFSISPRFGLQFDINSKTRFRTAYTSKTEEKNWANAIDLEGASVAFQEPVVVEDFVVEKGKPQMNKSRRLEFGIERILDNKSSIEANAFFDTTLSRGVGLMRLPFASVGSDEFSDFVADQQGNSQGIRIVYNRRLNSLFSTSAGYSFGNGQKISEKAFTNPSEVFENDFFQSFYGQVNADLKTGTSIKTIFRLSPQATVFAVDPFQGRLAIYDPGLSVLVTQSLPTLGLPIRAEAIMDARNLFDFQTGIAGEEGSLRLNSQGRILRGGILVRF